jgi:5-methylcytosine-specific restriction endonuclease McrA
MNKVTTALQRHSLTQGRTLGWMKDPEGERERKRRNDDAYRRRHQDDPDYRERLRAKDKRYREVNGAARRRRRVARYTANKEAISEQRRRDYAANPEPIREHSRRWAHLNAEKKRAQDNAYRAANPETKKLAHHARRARLRNAPGSHTVQQWLALIEQFGGACGYCGLTIPLLRDHRVPLSRGGSNDIDNIIPACRSCNARKHAKTEAEFRAICGRQTNETHA